jgi:tetratricopeptide (TPR) repeat protein
MNMVESASPGSSEIFVTDNTSATTSSSANAANVNQSNGSENKTDDKASKWSFGKDKKAKKDKKSTNDKLAHGKSEPHNPAESTLDDPTTAGSTLPQEKSDLKSDLKPDLKPDLKEALSKDPKAKPAGVQNPQASLLVRLSLIVQFTMMLFSKINKQLVEVYNNIFTISAEDSAQIANNLGFDAYSRSQYDRARIEFKKAIAMNENLFQSYYGLGLCYLASDQSEMAVGCFEKVLKLNGDSVEVMIELVHAHHKLQDYPAMITLYNKLIELDPRNAEHQYRLGMCYDQTDKKQDALSCLKNAIEIDNAEPRYVQNLGFLYEELGKRKEAVICFKNAIELEEARA